MLRGWFRSRSPAALRGCAALGLLGLAACGVEAPPPTPSAVITASPAAICLGDAHATLIGLSAEESQSLLTLVPVPEDPDAPPLALTWSFTGAEHTLVSGDAHAEVLTLTTAGDRPLHVGLMVENRWGGRATAALSIAVTPLDAEGRCPLDEGAP